MKKLFLKALLFSCTILLFNCQSEDLNKDLENHSHKDKNLISFKSFLDKTEIKNFNFEISKNFNSNTSNFSREASDFTGFVVDTTLVKQYIQKSGNLTFTMPVIPLPYRNTENLFYNIVYYKSNNIWQWSVLEYEKVDAQTNDYRVNEIINDFNNNGLLHMRLQGIWKTTISFNCVGCQGACDLCHLCVSTTTTYDLAILDDPISKFHVIADYENGNNGGGSLYNTYLTSFVNGLSQQELSIFYANPSIEQFLVNNLIVVPRPNYNPLIGGNPTMVIVQPQAAEYAEELIHYINTNNNSPEAVEEVNTILDLIDDGKIDGQDVVLAPDQPITNMTQYLSIFNTSQPAIITLSADQPISGSHFPFDPTTTEGKAGHAILTIKQGTKVRSLGFYPENTAASILPNTLTPDPTDFISVPSSFGNDENHYFDVSISTPITAAQLLSAINNIKSIFQSNVSYNIKSSNCADFAIIIFNANTNVTIPSCESPKIYWNGQTPATLGEVIKSMNLPSGATRNTIGGTIPPNNSN